MLLFFDMQKFKVQTVASKCISHFLQLILPILLLLALFLAMKLDMSAGSDPVYTMPVEFENGIKKCLFGLPFTRCRQNFQILPAEFCFG